MQRTRFGDITCSIARTWDVIGEPWSPLILRDVYVGITRFDQLQQELGVSSKVLSERLRWLVDHGVLAREAYSSRPARYEYTLTEKGSELCDLLLVMVRWGDRWTAGETGPPVLYRHDACGQVSHVDLRCAACGRPMHATDVEVLPGPGAASGPTREQLSGRTESRTESGKD
ncbi:winged helix-turn-helix transcriptional regulator [Georgenia alba]|uniref:Winged helix-turn-helix transcriptional regulator n=1 Tax=Georgenia alba TaxID=2233858 RepID=A0ABW2Q6V3_9MICO